MILLPANIYIFRQTFDYIPGNKLGKHLYCRIINTHKLNWLHVKLTRAYPDYTIVYSILSLTMVICCAYTGPTLTTMYS